MRFFMRASLAIGSPRKGSFDPSRIAELKKFVEAKQREYNLGTVELFSPDGQPFVVAFNQQVPTGVTIKPESEFLNRALRGLEVTRTQAFGEGDVIRGGVPIYARDKRILGVVVVDYYVPKSISQTGDRRYPSPTSSINI